MFMSEKGWWNRTDDITSAAGYVVFFLFAVASIVAAAIVIFGVNWVKVVLMSGLDLVWWLLWCVGAIWVNTSVVYIFRDWVLRIVAWIVVSLIMLKIAGVF